ncbi:MAG: DUF1641 domain-containing protein [Myxococcota bacterium]
MSEPRDRESIDERLARIEHQLARLTDALDQALPTAGMVLDAADELAADLQRRGIDLDEQASEALRLFEKLADPDTMSSLHALVDALPKLVPVVDLATTFRDTTGMLFDMADAQVASLQQQGIDVEARVGQVLDLLARLTEPEVHQHLLELADAAPNLLAATRTGELFGRAMDEVSGAPRRSVGLWGLLGALSEPEVQRATGFAIDLARRVGERLPDHFDRPQLTPHPIPTAK